MTQVVILGEAWGQREAEAGKPFVGPTGLELNRLCEEAGLIAPGSVKTLWNEPWRRDEIYYNAGIHLTNVFNLHPPDNNIEALCGPRWGDLPALRTGKYLRAEFLPELERTQDELAAHAPNLVLGLGATASWFMVGATNITKLRGAVAHARGLKFLPTYHPAFLMRGAWNLRPVVVFDFLKAARERAFPEVRRPERQVFIVESIEDLDWCHREFVECLLSTDRVAVDIETMGDQITCVGFSFGSKIAVVVPITDPRRDGNSFWSGRDELVAWRFIRAACASPAEKVLQNGLYDIHFLYRRYGIEIRNAAHDTMLLHHALQPEAQKALDFLGSIYTDEAAWKLMRGRGKGTIKRED